MEAWVNAEKELPKRDDIYRVRLFNGDIVRAYFYNDAIAWIAFYGEKPCHWWHRETKEALTNVVEWKRHKTTTK